jgi:nucleoside-diphosphate-sugar epimerase
MIFVTGGTGFLGRHLIARLCRDGRAMRVLTRHPHEHLWLQTYPNVEVVAGDLAERQLLIDAVADCDTVIHAGGIFRFWGDEQVFMQTNKRGTDNMVHAALQADIKKFIHISSVAVIGQPRSKYE